MCEQQEYSEFPSHTVSYEIMTNADDEDKERSFTVLATPQKIDHLGEQGYLIGESQFSFFSVRPKNSLVDALQDEADAETRELLGIGGYQ